MADINSSTASTSSGGRSLLLERLARKKRAALRKTVPVARDEEELRPQPRMDPVLDFPSEDGWEEPSSVDVEQDPSPLRHQTKPTQPAHRRWGTSYPRRRGPSRRPAAA